MPVEIITDMPEIILEAEKVFAIFGFPISNSIVASWLTMLILIVISILATRNMKLVPTGLQNVVETVLEMFYESVAKVRAGEQARLSFRSRLPSSFSFCCLTGWEASCPASAASVSWSTITVRRFSSPSCAPLPPI